MCRLLVIIPLAFFLSFLVYRAGTVGLRLERPYEEALLRVALRENAPAFTPSAVWSEHPPLAYLLLRGCAALVGQDIHVLRFIWFSLFLCGFVTLVYWARPSLAPTESKRMGSLDFAEEVLRGVLLIALFACPIILVGGIRIGPDAIVYLLFAIYVGCAAFFLRKRSTEAAIAMGVAGALLLYSHAYGWLCTMALTLALGILFVRRSNRSLSWKILLIALLSLSPLVIDHAGFIARIALLREHYWADAVAGEGLRRIPLTPLWVQLSELPFQSLPIIAQTTTCLLLVWAFVRSRDDLARWLALSCLLCIPLFWFLEYFTHGRVVVCHWLGLWAIIAIVSLARGLGLRLLFLSGVASVFLLLIPAITSVALTVGEGNATIQRAEEAIRSQLKHSDAVVFAGVRTYVMFMPDLQNGELTHSYVFHRTSFAPESFAGCELIPRDRLIPDEQWAAFSAKRIVVVQLDAAQKVVVPLEGWQIDERTPFIHNSLAIGQISIETRHK